MLAVVEAEKQRIEDTIRQYAGDFLGEGEDDEGSAMDG